jgi:hypothetical protein
LYFKEQKKAKNSKNMAKIGQKHLNPPQKRTFGAGIGATAF